jgi:hypothetical protein
MTETSAALTPRDLLTGHLAALIPGQPQAALEAAADGFSTLGYRLLDPAAVKATLDAHQFIAEEDGDGWNEPRWASYRCFCNHKEYVQWMQRDPECSGLEEFQGEGHDAATALHHAHVTEMLTGTAPAEPQEPEYMAVITEEAIVRGANQLRSQTSDFTSPDVLMRKRARFVLIAALRYLGVERVR